jgi:hypothetical protein
MSARRGDGEGRPRGRTPALALVLALALALAGCSGKGGDATGPDPLPDPPVQDPGIPDPTPGVQGSYVLAQINQSAPGQLVTIAGGDGHVIGLYRFEATTLELDALQAFDLEIRYTDDKADFGYDDSGEFKQAGPIVDNALPLTFTSDVYGDSFTGVVLEDIVAIKYDFDGDGEAETSFSFRRAD